MVESNKYQKAADVVVLPEELTNLIGGLSTGRGELENNVKIFAWDAVKDCNGRECPGFRYCACEDIGQPCDVMRRYIAQVYSVVLKASETQAPEQKEAILLRIGFDLIPLYKILISLKIAEMGVDKVIEMDIKGTRRANPIFKEIRETIKTIEFTWKTIGLGNFIGVPAPPIGASRSPVMTPIESSPSAMRRKRKTKRSF
jgi:hypothetical protein